MDDTEASLRAETAELERRLAERKHSAQFSRPSRFTRWIMALLALAVITAAFCAGYLPRQRRESVLASEVLRKQ